MYSAHIFEVYTLDEVRVIDWWTSVVLCDILEAPGCI